MNAAILPAILIAAMLASPSPAQRKSAPPASAAPFKAGAPAPPLPQPQPQPQPQGNGTGFSFQDWHVQTNQLDANWQSGSFNAPVHITLTRPGSDISADRMVGNFKQHQATLTGHVVLHDTNGVLTNFAGEARGSHEPAMLTCDTLNIEGSTKQYIATGNVFFKQGGSQVRAGRAVMDGITHEIHLFDNVQLTQ